MAYFATGAALTAALNKIPTGIIGSYVPFNDFYYAQTYMGAYAGTLTPIEHFVQVGAARGYQPNADFNPTYYQTKYTDLKGLDSADLLYHYVNFGLNEGRAGNATLAAADWTGYLATYPDVAAYVTANLSSFGGSKTNGAIAHYVKFGVAQGFALPTTPASESFTLTTGINGVNGGTDFTGGAAGDFFTALPGTWTTLDVIDGAAGSDTFNITETSALSLPTGATVSNIETINAISTSTVTLSTRTGFSGLTALNTTSTGGATVGAAATTAVSVTNTDAATSAEAIAVTGGSTASVTSTNNVGDTISVGSATAPAAAAVTVSSSSATASTSSTQGAITVTGGTSISVTQSAANTAATGSATTAGAVTINGNTSTTTVTVSDTAAATGFTATSSIAGVKGRVNGAVTINDVNEASTSLAGTITTVTLNSFAAADIDSSAINTVNLSGKGTSVSIGRGDLSATPTANTLAVNVSGLTLSGALTDAEAASDDGFTTVNIVSSTTASTLGSIAFADATTVNVSGDAKFTSAGETLTAVTAINVTNSAGASFATAIGTGVTFTGGEGADAVTLSSGFTKSNTMGAGNDTVTYGGAASTTTGAKGFMNAGDGTDTIIMTDAQAAAADDSAAFNAAFSNFETLRISDTFVEDALNLDGINGVTKVILANSTNSVTGSATINNLKTGGTVELRSNGTTTPSLTVNVTSALTSASDVLNLTLNKDGALAVGTVTAAYVETINISNADAPTAPTLGFAAAVDTLTLVATAATSITVSGNNGLTLTNTGNTAVTSFNASGVVANDTAASATLSATEDTAANLAVTFASANTSTTATVTITGGAGNDTLSGNNSKDTINGGAGVDTIDGGAGQDTLTGGAGADVFYFDDGDSNYNAIDLITDLSTADSIVYGNANVAFSGAVTGTGTTATISAAGVATFTTVSGVAAATLVDKVKVLDSTLSTDGRAVLFDQDGATYMYINTDTATTADLTGIVIQLTGVALPASATTDGASTGLSGFGA